MHKIPGTRCENTHIQGFYRYAGHEAVAFKGQCAINAGMTSSPHTDTLNWLLDYTNANGATACDAVLFESVDISASCRLGKPEGLERSERKALGLRAFAGQQSAIVSGSDTSKEALKELAERAIAMAKATPADCDSVLADPSLHPTDIPDLHIYDAEEPGMEWFNAQCKETEDAARAVEGITNSEGADAQYGTHKITLAIHNGAGITFSHSYNTSHFSLSVSVLAGTGTNMERDYEFSSARYRSDLDKAQWIGKEAAKRVLRRLNPRKVATCQAPVVFDPRVSRSFLSILAGSISGNAITRGSSFLKNDLHKQVFPESITIVDDPHMLRGLGSKPFDGEGVKNGQCALVENGVLATWLLDLRSAKKLGMKTTGHATRGIASPPSPSSSNLYMQAGFVTPKELISDIKSGFYVTETFGMGINTTTGDYSQGAAGFWVENGEIAYPVSEVTIAGHLRDMFATLTPANDLVYRYATNAPTLRVESMTVAGT